MDILEKIDEVISDVVAGHGEIPIDVETARYRYQRPTYTEQHNVICDSSFIPLTQDNCHWLSSNQHQQASEVFPMSSSAQTSERGAVAELITSILSTGANSNM